jgi:hypothetical protein
LLVCEGPADAAFFHALLGERAISDFGIRHTGQGNPAGTGGVDVFAPFLNGLPSVAGFYELTDIVLVADSDNDPEERFQYLCKQIGACDPDAKPSVEFKAPSKPNQLKIPSVTMPGAPCFHILLLPSAATQGGLETLCLQAAADRWRDEANCVDGLVECAGAGAWPVTKLAKMKLAALMASVFKKNPNVAFGRIWVEGGKNDLVPLKHPCFDFLETFFRSMART